MEDWTVIIKSFIEYGVFCGLFIGLFYYTIKNNERREIGYQLTIKNLCDGIGVTVIDSNKIAKIVQVSCETIHDNMRVINGELDKVKDGVFEIKGRVEDIQITIGKGIK